MYTYYIHLLIEVDEPEGEPYRGPTGALIISIITTSNTIINIDTTTNDNNDNNNDNT